MQKFDEDFFEHKRMKFLDDNKKRGVQYKIIVVKGPLSLSLSSSKGTFSPLFEEKSISKVVRIGR